METIFDQIIAFLQELRGASVITQATSLVGAAGLLLTIVGGPFVWARRKTRASVTQYAVVRDQRDTAQAQARKLEGEIIRLHDAMPEAYVARHRKEMRDGKEEKSMALAEGFLDKHRDAIGLALRTRMDEAVRQSVEDGAPAFENAHGWGRAALMLNPDDADLRRMVEDVSAAASVAAASGGRVKIRATGEARQDRLPQDVAAVTATWFKARAAGQYALCLGLAEHGLMLTRRAPYGPGCCGAMT